MIEDEDGQNPVVCAEIASAADRSRTQIATWISRIVDFTYM